ncbi:BBP7 family outer membrane beta-barrel protein [Pirellulaceae bacterium SH449]
MNRLLALLIVATIAGGTAFGQSQGTRRVVASPTIRTSESGTVTRTSSVPRPGSPTLRSPGRLVSERSLLQEPIDDGVVLYSDEPERVYADEYYDPNEGLAAIGGCSDGSCGVSGCDSCGLTCGTPFGFDLCDPYGLDGRILCLALPSHGWVNVEYLMWYQRGVDTPALVTTSPAGTAQAAAGVLPNATTLFGGNNDVLTDRLNGMRVRFGWWFVNNPKLGIEGEYVGTAETRESFDLSSNGNPILARPFYNVTTGREDAQLVAFPGVVAGRVQVDATSQFRGAAVRFRRSLCCDSGCGFSRLTCGPVPAQSRFDATLGWRYFQLDDTMGVRENLTGVSPAGSFLIQDNFQTRNQFNGVELGVMWQGRKGYWSLDTLMRLGLGNTRQTVMIDGSTTINNGAAQQGGLLAQRTNIGTYQRDQFSVVPELGATLGYQLTQRMRLTAGYSFIYWSNVVRAGEQMDTSVNPNLLPPENPVQNNFLDPRFVYRDTPYWIQGMNIGGEYRW